MTRMVPRSVKCFSIAVLLMICVGLHGLEFVVLNDVGDIAKTKKIMCKVDLSPGEKWVYREMLRFSSSNKKIKLRSWKASIASTSEYITQFHQAKRVFACPFDLELTFEGVGVEDAALAAELEQAIVMVSYVSQDEQQKHRAQAAVVRLVDGAKDFSMAKKDQTAGLALSMTTTMPGVVADVSVALPIGQVFSSCPPVPDRVFGDKAHGAGIHSLPDDEIMYLVRGEKFYGQLRDLATRIGNACVPIFVVIIFVLVLLLLLMRFFMRSQPWFRRFYPVNFAHIVFALLPPAVIHLIAVVISAGLASIMLGGYFLVLGCYLVITQHEQQKTLKVKSLLLLGGTFIVMALPLVLKGILLFYS